MAAWEMHVPLKDPEWDRFAASRWMRCRNIQTARLDQTSGPASPVSCLQRGSNWCWLEASVNSPLTSGSVRANALGKFQPNLQAVRRWLWAKLKQATLRTEQGNSVLNGRLAERVQTPATTQFPNRANRVSSQPVRLRHNKLSRVWMWSMVQRQSSHSN